LPENTFAEIQSEYEKVMEEKRHSDKLRQRKFRHSDGHGDANSVTVTRKKRHSDTQVQTATNPETIGSVGVCSASSEANSVMSRAFKGVGGSVHNNTLLTPVTNDHLNAITDLACNPKINILKEKINKKEKISKENVAQDFEIFWKAYPKKVKRKNALRAFGKVFANAKHPTLDTLLKAIETQKQSSQWQKPNGQYIPHPTTWLNGELWNDEPSQPPACAPQSLAPPTESEAIAYGQSMGFKTGREFYGKFSAMGWKNCQGNPITDWRKAMKSYEEEYSQ
jgi:hypothetical protein